MAKRLSDGSYVQIRHNQEEERELDKTMIRCKGQLKWYPRDLGKDVKELNGKFAGQKGYIVGKGVSLDAIEKSNFGDGPIICLNESIHKIESLGLKNQIFMLQQDGKLKETCQPKDATILLSVNSRHFYKDKYIFVPESYGLAFNGLSVLCAIEILKAMGVNSISLVCFDACVNGSTGYANAVGYPSTVGGDPKRFLNHRNRIEEQLKGMEREWIIPTTTKHDVAICVIVKNEQHYIEEWIEYHRLIGVSHFFVYDNGCTDGTLLKLKPYLESGLITLIPWPQYPAQVEAYQHCLKTFSHRAQWISFTDVDEFFVVESGLSLPLFLYDYKSYAGLAVHWLFFGSNGEVERKDGLVIERFTKCSATIDVHVKTIVNTDFSDELNYTHPHLPKGGMVVDENKKQVLSPRCPGTGKLIRINHYFTKSKKEFIDKVDKGRVDIVTKRSYSEFGIHDLNEVFDLCASMLASKIKNNLIPDITLITATGDRPEAFRLCEKWISNQTFSGRIQWIVVDDGVTPTNVNLGQSYVRRTRQPEDPAHTLIPNLRVAFPLIKSDYVFFIEDDDYYSPQYLAVMFEHLKQKPLVGLQKARYYNIKERKYREFRNENHASLCSTGIARSLFPLFEKCLEDNSAYIDLRMFKAALINPRNIDLFENHLVVGIKGMPGRAGLMKGHTELPNFEVDRTGGVLKEWVGNDSKFYTQLGQGSP